MISHQNWKTNMKLSVLIPTYNHEKFIAKAIEGALAQETNFKFEILIGEDESEDGTREICKYYADQNPEKIRLFLNSRENVIYIDGKPTGRANLINLLKNASGKYIALCEGDDYWTDKQKLQIQYNFLEKNLDAALCFHKVNWLVDNKLEKDPGIFPKNRNWFTAEDILLYDNFIRTCSVVFRNNLYVRLPQWFYTVPYGDVALHMLNAQSGKIGFIDKEMGVYRVHKGGIYTSKNNIVKWMGSIETYKIIAENLGYNENLNFKTGLSKLYYAIAIEGKRLGDYYVNKVSEKTLKIKHQIYHNGDLTKNYSHINTNVSKTLASRKNQPNKVLDKIYSAQGNHIEKLNILFVSHNFPPEHFAGVENYTYQLAKGMAKYGHQVSVFYPNIRFGQDKVKLEKSKYDNLTIYQIFVKNNNDIISHIKNHEIEELFSNLLNKNIFDIIHFQHTYHYLPFSLIEIAKDKKIPVCITLHDFWFMCLRTHMFIENKKKICSGPESAEKCVKCVFEDTTIYIEKEKYQALTKLLEYRCKYIRKLFKEVDIITAPSQYLFYKYTSYNFGLNNIEILPLGIKPVEICRKNNNRNNVNFGYIGSIHKLKNIEYLVDEFATLKGNSKLIIRGNGLKKSIEELKSKIKFFDNIDYKGPYSPTELPQILSEFDVLIVPSYIENYPLVVREALSAKIPVIASNVGGIPEIITHMENGILFNPKIKGELKKHLINIVQNPELIKNLKKNIKVPKTINEEVKEWEEKYLRLVYRKNKKVTCSIIIPVFNRVEFTKKCIEAILRNTPSELYEIIVIDNASSDETKMFLSNIENRIKIIYNETNIGFAKACNQGAKLANGEFLVFLNNDTIPVAGWLESMVAYAEKDDEIGVIGSKLLYPDGTIQHAGIELINGVPDHPFRNAPGDMPEANTMRELDMVTGACLLIKKEIFERCNGFDENYRNGVEDVDLCLKVRELGFKVVYNPQSILYHHEGKTAGRFDHVRENLELFFKRWGQRFDHNGKFIQQNTLEKTRIIWEGSQFVNHSLALVNREMCRSLAKLDDIELSLVPYEPHQFDASADPVKYSTIAKLLNHRLSAPTDVHIRHQWPPNFTPPKEGHWVMIQPWEFGALPKDWVEPMRSQVDELWVYSNYVREVYINSGIPASKVFVVPLGVDYENFHSQAKPNTLNTEKTFKFLFVGGTIPRKGIDVLLDAYTSAFNRADDVCLVIKDMGVGTFYSGQSATERIMAIQKDVDAPEILYYKEYLIDKHMAGLYTACDCLVHPYRGEGFGLPVAEAMACGLPVLVTRGGACDDFCNDNNSFLIESQRRPIVMNHTELCDNGWVLEPNKDDLIRQLRFLYENKKQGRKSGAVAAREIRELANWDKSADLVVQRIKEIKNKPIIRLQLKQGQKSYDINNSDLLSYTSIQEQISNGDFEGAITKLEDLVGSKPELAVAYNDLGVLYHRQEENSLALTRYRRAVDLEPGNTNFRKNLADLLVVTFGEYEEALQHYVAVLAADPKDAEALLATGHICARLERYDDAAEFYERVLEIEPNNSDAPNWLAKMREKISTNSLKLDLNYRYQTLLSEIAQEDLAGAITKIKHFIEMYPTHGQAHNDLGVLFYKNESKTKVLANYLKAVELEPENVTYRKNLADFLYVEEGRVEEALENYVEVLRIKPDDVETLLITGHICTAIERFDDAMGFYHKVLDIEPQNLDARQNMEALEKRQISMLNQEAMDEEKPDDATEINQAEHQATVDEAPVVQDGAVEEFINKADLLFQQERIDQAVDTMLKAIAVNPSDGRTYVELAGQLVNLGRHENALEVLAEMPTNQPVAVATQKLLMEGYAEEGMGNYAAAKKCCDGVLAREPKNAKAFNLNGIIDYRNGNKTTAEQQFKRAIELDSEYGEPHTNLGALVWEKEDPKRALEHYERGFSISPTDIDVANAYHEAVTATGAYDRAEKVAQDALKRYPHCRKVLYLLIDTLIRQEKTKEALNKLENALSTFGIDEGLLDTALAFREQIGNTKKTGSNKKPGVSLCMIVKDEETNLARCLASVKPIVDEMIVVDTGSTDRTRVIAEFFGARVFDFEWRGDFAEARNFSLSKAEGGWILIMDADEVISTLDYDHFRKLTNKKPSRITAYSIITRNYCHIANNVGWNPNDGYYAGEEAGIGWLPSEKVRLFSNNKKIRFEGAVHEMVDSFLKRSNIKTIKCAIPVHHYGRLNAYKLDQKGQAYYDIGCKKLAANGGDIGAVRELAIQATELKKNSEAIDLWQKFLSMKPE